MAAHWRPAEDIKLENILEDGVSIQSVLDTLPNKTEGAIITRAKLPKLGLDYRVSRKDGKFYKGVFRRNRSRDLANECDITTNNIKFTESLERTTKLQSSKSIANQALKPNIGLEANNIVIRILQSENLTINAKIIYKLSTYIEELLL